MKNLIWLMYTMKWVWFVVVPKIGFEKLATMALKISEKQSALNAVVALKGEAGAIAMILWLWRGERKLPLTVYVGRSCLASMDVSVTSAVGMPLATLE